MPACKGNDRQAIDPLLLVSSFFAVSQICGFTPRVEVNHSYPAMDRNIKMFRQFEQVSEPCCMMFRELRGKNEATVFYKKERKERKKRRRKRKEKERK